MRVSSILLKNSVKSTFKLNLNSIKSHFNIAEKIFVKPTSLNLGFLISYWKSVKLSNSADIERLCRLTYISVTKFFSVKMVKIFHLKNCEVWLEKVWSKRSRFANQKYDRESVGQSWSKWSRFSILKSVRFALRLLWSKWSKFANQKYDRESVGQSWSQWSRFSV